MGGEKGVQGVGWKGRGEIREFQGHLSKALEEKGKKGYPIKISKKKKMGKRRGCIGGFNPNVAKSKTKSYWNQLGGKESASHSQNDKGGESPGKSGLRKAVV